MNLSIAKLHFGKNAFFPLLLLLFSTLFIQGCIKEMQEGEIINTGNTYIVYPDLKPELLWSKEVDAQGMFGQVNFEILNVIEDKIIYRSYDNYQRLGAIDALSGVVLWEAENVEYVYLDYTAWFLPVGNVLYYIKKGNSHILLIDLETGALIERRNLPARVPSTNGNIESIYKDGILYLKDEAENNTSQIYHYGIKLFKYNLFSGTHEIILEVPSEEIIVYGRCLVIDHENQLAYWYVSDFAGSVEGAPSPAELLYQFDLEKQEYKILFKEYLYLAGHVVGSIYLHNNMLVINRHGTTRTFELETQKVRWSIQGIWRPMLHLNKLYYVSDNVVLFSQPLFEERLAADILSVNLYSGSINQYIETRLKHPHDRSFIPGKAITLTHLPVQESAEHNTYGSISIVNDLHSGEVLMLFHLREYFPNIDKFLRFKPYFNSRGDYILTDGHSIHAFKSPL